MQDIVFSFDLLTLTFLFLLVFPVYCFLIRKQIFTWFDPLLIFVFFNSISVSFVIYLYFFMENIKQEYFISFILCWAGFVLGINFGGRKGLPKWENKLNSLCNANYSKHYFLLVDVFMVICLLIMFFSNFLLLMFKGTLPIFSANPSEAKILLYTGGWGFVKRINFSLVNFVLTIPLLKLFHPSFKVTQKRKIFYMICFFLCVFILISMGAKSSLLIILNILFALFLINKTYGISIKDRLLTIKNIDLIMKYAKRTFVIAIFFMFLIIILSGVETSSGDSLITRLVASGDVFYFFYVFDIQSEFHYTALDYLPHFFNPLLGMFRLANYEFGIGVYVLNYAIGLPMDADAVFGPNAQFPIEGLIYFGKFGAAIYSFIVGGIISWVRVGIINNLGPYPNCFLLMIYIVFSSLIVTMGTDVPLFTQIFFDHLIFGSIIVILSLALVPILKRSKI